MADIGRTTTPDPHAENYFSLSPYSMFANNPLTFVDPDGKDYAIYFSESEGGNVTYTATVTATYYVEKGNADAKASAENATGYWNDKSGECTYTVGKGEDAKTYGVNFDLKVVEVDNPVQQAQIDKSSLKTNGESKLVTDGSSNAYKIVPDDNTSQHGGYSTGLIKVEEADMNNYTGAHEVGHSLGIDHSNGIMHEGINADLPSTNNWNIKDVFVNRIPIKTTQNLYGNVPENYEKGRVRTGVKF